MALSDLTASAVLRAIEEFDQLGRDAFLEKYGFGKAREYLIQKDGRLYDSKAIVGAAHGYLPGQTALKPNDFYGGEATVKKTLDALKIDVVVVEASAMPSPGDVLTNEEIGLRFNVGNMGGMRRSTKRNLLVLISDPFKGLYQDRWEDEILHYTGMGPTGDQSLSYAQNRTLAESSTTRIPIHLLEALEPLKYTYVGEVDLVGAPYQEEQSDGAGQVRNVWMFPVKLRNGAAIPTLTERRDRGIPSAIGSPAFDAGIGSARQESE